MCAHSIAGGFWLSFRWIASELNPCDTGSRRWEANLPLHRMPLVSTSHRSAALPLLQVKRERQTQVTLVGLFHPAAPCWRPPRVEPVLVVPDLKRETDGQPRQKRARERPLSPRRRAKLMPHERLGQPRSGGRSVLEDWAVYTSTALKYSALMDEFRRFFRAHALCWMAARPRMGRRCGRPSATTIQTRSASAPHWVGCGGLCRLGRRSCQPALAFRRRSR